jgi:hypothetical protein
MNKVQRNELLSFAAYEEIRPHFRGRMIEQKKQRRVIVGEHMSLTFENHDSVLLQVQEMMRTERISDELAIKHELDTYNELVPAPGSLSATLFIEYTDPAERADMLRRFASLRTAFHLRIGEHTFTATFSTHFGEEFDRLPAVNYLTIVVGTEHAKALLDPSVPAQIEVTHPDYRVATDLARPVREQLAHDLSS